MPQSRFALFGRKELLAYVLSTNSLLREELVLQTRSRRHDHCSICSHEINGKRVDAYALSDKRAKQFVPSKEKTMRYGIAWLLGVPLSVIVLWYVVAHMM